jgi:nucleotide-binding universal stress UspA family protein
MKILFAADGSSYTKKALAFLVTHDAWLDDSTELEVLHVRQALPSRVNRFVSRGVVETYHHDEAEKVLAPLRKFLDKHPIKYKTHWIIGSPAQVIVKAASRSGAHLILMGTHGHGVVGRLLPGSVAQKVIVDCECPVLLVK